MVNYFTFGAAVTEEKILCTCIVMDLRNSSNPAIDIAQIESGFMQRYG